MLYVDWLKSVFENQIMSLKINLRIITKTFAADAEKGFPTKAILQPFGIMSPFRQRGN